METQTSSTEQDELAIRRLIYDWAEAVRRRDLPGILRHHAADIVMFDVPPPLQSTGIEPYRQTWTQFFAWSHDPVVFDITEIRIIAGTDLGFAYALMRCSGGRDPDLRFRLTLGLRKVENRWVVLHEHHSIPAET